MATVKKKIVKKAAPAKKVAAGKKTATVRRVAPVLKKVARVAAPVVAAKALRPNGADLQREVEQFLYAQAEALDRKQWQAFIDLFADDGVYWAPTDPEHTHWDGMPSIFTEDRDLMTVRMKRILHPNAWSQQAEWATNHVVGNVVIESSDAKGNVHVRSRFHLLELRRDDVRHFAGSYRHHLVRGKDGKLRIKLQRADLVNAQAPFEYVLQAWV